MGGNSGAPPFFAVMTKWLTAALLAVSIMAVCVIGWAFWQWGKAAPDFAPTMAKVNQALDKVNDPGTGTLAEVGKTVVKAGDAIVQTQLTERSSTAKVNATMDALATIPPHVTPVLDEAKGTLSAATGLTVALTGDAQEAKTTIAAAQPVLAAFTQDATDLDALLKDKAIHETLTNVDSLTGSMAGITADGKQVTDKMTADYLKARTPWGKIGHVALDAFDVTAAVARHTP